MAKAKVVTDGRTTCSVCKQDKPLDDFPPDKRTTFGRHSRCYECKRARDRNYQKTEQYLIRRRAMEWTRRGILDISPERFLELLAQQDGKCAICGATEGPNGKVLCVDHDHATGLTRGLLCTKCNVAIGYLKDDVELVRKALEYLEANTMKVIV